MIVLSLALLPNFFLQQISSTPKTIHQLIKWARDRPPTIEPFFKEDHLRQIVKKAGRGQQNL